MKSNFFNHISGEHKSAARALGFALTLGDFDAWAETRFIWGARLKPAEIGAMAYTCLTAIEPETAWDVVETALGTAGRPLPPFMYLSSEAAFWASVAAPDELRAFALASFNAMNVRDQSDFLGYVQSKVTA